MQRLTSALLLASFLLILPARGDEKNGLRVTVQKKVIDKSDFRTGYYYDTEIDRTMGLKVTIVNESFTETPARTVDYSMIVQRWGWSPARFERYAGSQPLEAIKPAGTTDFVVGSSHMGGYSTSDHSLQDKVEAWKIVVKEGDKEIIKMVSGANFDAVDKKAINAPKPAKKK